MEIEILYGRVGNRDFGREGQRQRYMYEGGRMGIEIWGGKGGNRNIGRNIWKRNGERSRMEIQIWEGGER